MGWINYFKKYIFFRFKEKEFKKSSKFAIFSIIITFFLVLLNPHEGGAFNNLIFTSNYQLFVKCLILISILFVFILYFEYSEPSIGDSSRLKMLSPLLSEL